MVSGGIGAVECNGIEISVESPVDPFPPLNNSAAWQIIPVVSRHPLCRP